MENLKRIARKKHIATLEEAMPTLFRPLKRGAESGLEI